MDQTRAVTNSEETPVNRVTVDEVRARLDRREPIVFVDSRSEKAWNGSEVKIRGAFRVSPERADEFLSRVPKDRGGIITYCT